MKRSKKILVGTLAICTVAALGIGGTLAFLTDSEQVTNHFSMGDLDITIDEPHWDDDGTPEDDGGTPDEPGDDTPGTPGDGENLTPGDTRDKDPTVSAVEGDSYMRVVMMVEDEDGNVITDETRLNLILQTIRYAEDDALKEGTGYSIDEISKYKTVNETLYTLDTKKSTAGIYYYNYNGIFKQGSKAELFSDAVIPTDWNHTEVTTVGKYQIVLQAQAIQSAGFSSSAAAFAAMDEEISAMPESIVDQNYKTVDEDSDSIFTIAGRTVSPE